MIFFSFLRDHLVFYSKVLQISVLSDMKTVKNNIVLWIYIMYKCSLVLHFVSEIKGSCDKLSSRSKGDIVIGVLR